ncbi:PP2C family protein-serine/threonine phosphatase [Paraburkholderia agricolaris]|uniref:PP2C family protein-serine/threonine phosphatase n=1 Tax=Paraburkholderia agricolaris TaxID=2152888 RepID=UPI0012925853|nr:SpoIIE family protein phosphatase [Paraburkholderia agricolaris]
MLSRNRFLLASVALLTLVGCISGWFIARSYRLNADASQQIAIQSLRWMWLDAQHDQLELLDDTARTLLNSRQLCKALRAHDGDALARVLRDTVATRPSPGWIELYDADGTRLYANRSGSRIQPLLGDVMRRTLAARPERAIGGPIPWRNDRYLWVRATTLRCAGTLGYLALGADMEPALARIAAATGAQIFLINVHGNEVMASGTTALGDEARRLPFGQGALASPVIEGERYETISMPIDDPAGHAVGLLVAARALGTMLTAAERHFLLTVAAIGLTVFAGIACLAVLVQGLSRALQRIASVTRRLAVLDTAARLDLEDDELPGSFGKISRHVGEIRRALIELNLLRDERQLAWQRQEDMIRTQLRSLSKRLDNDEQNSILLELEDAGHAPAGNQLLALSATLSRMTGYIASQQERVVQLLAELSRSVEAKTALAALQRELAIAREIQQSILPRAAPDTRAVRIAASMVPANEIGGDFYGYTLLDEHRLSIDIGDVSGKGVGAALFMALVRTLLNNGGAPSHSPSPSRRVRDLNARLAVDNEQQMFVTLFHGVLDLRTGRLSYVICGHPPPVLCRAASCTFMAAQGNPALGIVDDYCFAEAELTLAPGDTLFLYTDGVSEAFSEDGSLFGKDRLLRALGGALSGAPRDIPEVDSQTLPTRIIDTVRQFENGRAPSDDIACVSVTYLGPSGHDT